MLAAATDPIGLIVFDYFLRTMTVILGGTACYAAAVGLQTWKKQIHGQYRFDLARRIAVATWKNRNLIDFSRRGMGAYNFESLIDRANDFESELRLCVVEAQLVLGKEAEREINGFLLECSLYWTMAAQYFKSLKETNPNEKEAPEQESQFKKYIYAMPADGVVKKFEASADKIMNMVKEYLPSPDDQPGPLGI